jgi:hypothetical protein
MQAKIICLATQIARKTLKLGENGVTDSGWLAENSSLTYVARFKHIQNILWFLHFHH